MRKPYSFTLLLIAAIAFLGAGPASGDTIKMKDGTTHEGRITYEADDIVKIEVQRSASIKETKVLATDQIAEVIKSAPDDVEFAKIQKLVPTGSLVSTDKYKSMLATGPVPFLEAYPDSKHRTKVEEIKETLDEELDKVERGFVKIEEEWYSPEDKVNFQTLLESKVRFLAMQAKMNQGNYTGFIGAMRDFEAIEENYYGAPAFPKAIEAARQIVPALGRQLQGMLRDVEFRNAEFEKNKEILNEVARAQVEAARANEEKQYQAGLALDKKAGIKWVRLNPRSKASIESYLSLAKSELGNLQDYDVEALREQAEKLVEVDKLIAEGNLDRAKSKFAEATGTSGKSSKKSSKKKVSKSYVGAISNKLSQKLAKRDATEKALQDAKASESLTKELADNETPIIPEGTAKTMKEGEEGEPKEGEEVTEEKPKENAFAALAQVDNKPKKESSKSSSKKSSKSSKEKKEDEDDDDEEERRPPSSSGGGFKIQYVIMGLTALMVIAVVLMKVLGIGGKKEE